MCTFDLLLSQIALSASFSANLTIISAQLIDATTARYSLSIKTSDELVSLTALQLQEPWREIPCFTGKYQFTGIE